MSVVYDVVYLVPKPLENYLVSNRVYKSEMYGQSTNLSSYAMTHVSVSGEDARGVFCAMFDDTIGF